ncbi:22971_t:CDS:1 [Cetraspora pellucida]|uniref:22971_t:CDS:1 n=1 Tax=Cetraspora pellucida TaxID=1433469 RepID=A0A9N9GNT0_9GLOM|nr:22971_t:CDS:1 [Cetraspora pellucida]
MTLENDQTLPRIYYEGEGKFLQFKIHDVIFCCKLPTPNELTFKSEGCKKLNDYTIFRKVLQQHLQTKSDNLKIARIQNVDISSLSGEIWKNSSKAFKEMFRMYAEEVNKNRTRHSQKQLSIAIVDPTGKKKKPRKVNKNKERKNNHSKQIIDKMKPSATSNIIDDSNFDNSQIMIPGNINDVKEIPEISQIVNVVKHPTQFNIFSPDAYMQPPLPSTSLPWSSFFGDVTSDFIDGINFDNLTHNEFNSNFQQLHTDHLTPVPPNNTNVYIPCQTTISNLVNGLPSLTDENNNSDIINGIIFDSSLYDGTKPLSTSYEDIINVNSIIQQPINPMCYMQPKFTSISPNDVHTYIPTQLETGSNHIEYHMSQLHTIFPDNYDK